MLINVWLTRNAAINITPCSENLDFLIIVIVSFALYSCAKVRSKSDKQKQM